jgi:hypothetical protein
MRRIAREDGSLRRRPPPPLQRLVFRFRHDVGGEAVLSADARQDVPEIEMPVRDMDQQAAAKVVLPVVFPP